jgi:predicted esterase
MSTSANNMAGAVIAMVLAGGAFLPIGSGCSSKDDEDGKQGSIAGSAPIAGGGMGGDPMQPPPAGGSGATTPPAAGGSSGSAAGNGGSSAHDAGTTPSSPDDDDAGSVPTVDAGGDDLPRTMQPIDAPVADDCIKDVSAGDHTFTCGGLTFLVLVDDMCTKLACGLIFDIHGATMSGAQMRDNTLLYKIAPSHGYIVVNPSATASNTGGTWDLTANPPTVGDFMDRMIKAFHIDPDRVHVTGFSQGSAMTFWFLQNKNAILASAAPVSGATDVAWMTDSWTPRVPILYENGQKDQASTIDRATTMVENIHTQLKLTGGMEIAGDGHYSRKHWTDGAGMDFDYIEHDYGGQAVLDGHCIPGGIDTPGSANNFSLNATTCTTGTITINWGELVLQWFDTHPKKH